MPTPFPAADKAEFWRQTIAEFVRPDLSIRAFCAVRGLLEMR